MTIAHGGSRLALKNMAPNLPEGMILFPLNGRVDDTTKSIPVLYDMTTLRGDAYKFSGSVAVEDGTTNLINPTVIDNTNPSEWKVTQLDTTKFKIEALVDAPTSWHYGVRIGSSYRLLAGTSGVMSISVLEQSSPNLTLGLTGFGASRWEKPVFGNRWYAIINYAEDWTFAIATDSTGADTGSLIKAGDYIIVEGAQIELKDHPTSFVNGTRGEGQLVYDISSLGMKDVGCISCWIYNSDALVNNKSVSEQINHKYLLKVGSSHSDWYKDVFSLWVRNASPRVFSVRNDISTASGGNISGSRTLDSFGIGSWVHAVFQWDKNGLPSGRKSELYINGTLEASGTDITSFPQNPMVYLIVGGWTSGGSLKASTLYEQLAVHPSKGFSAEQIKNWYEAQAPFFDSRDKFYFF